jgi:hypothetical protein
VLHAVKNGKTGHGINEREVPWRELFKGSEDSLTSTIFERLFYLSNETFWKILTACLPNNVLTSSPIDSFEFWPHWSAEDSDNQHFVEPDVFIRTKDSDFIIEAKKKGSEQSVQQWKNEIKSYRTSFPENRPCILIAIEGSERVTDSEVDGVPVFKTNWQTILDSVSNVLRDIELESNAAIGETQILRDLINGFGVHGYVTCSWFADMNPIQIHSENISFFNQD